MVQLTELISYFEELWPLHSADDWDRPGLSVGNKNSQISSILLSVDVTAGVVDEAIELGANLILSHHPLLLRGVNEVSENSLKGEIVTRAIRHDIAIYSAHTNADKAATGTAAALAELYGLTNTRVLDPETGHGLIGEISEPVSLLQFATKIAKLLPPVAAGVKVAGEHQAIVKTVALSAGAGDADLGSALAADVDVFITSDLRHHPAQDFVQTPGKPRALIDVSHWASESVYLDQVVELIRVRFPALEAKVSTLRTDPWDFAVMQ